jgi:hypothetical protein
MKCLCNKLHLSVKNPTKKSYFQISTTEKCNKPVHSLAALIFGHTAQPGRFSTVNNARRVGPKKSAQTKWTLGCPLGALGFILSDAHHV